MNINFTSYLIKNIPTKAHTRMKDAAKARRISIRQWLLEAIIEKLEATNAEE